MNMKMGKYVLGRQTAEVEDGELIEVGEAQ